MKMIKIGKAAEFAQCNIKANANSIMVGQEAYWTEKETEKEIKRREKSYHYSDDDYYIESYTPYGNEGPGYLARVLLWKPRAKKATFSWYRERLNTDYYDNRSPNILTKITVPIDRLFNVSAYKLGDYKQFFADSRSRSKYIKWAPMLMAAEEYHAGNLKPQEPIIE